MSLNAESWSPFDVAYWIAGLETNANPTPTERGFAFYSACFLQQNVSGRLLLNLMAGDLSRYGVEKVGDQLLLQDAIQALRSELDTPRMTLQSLASTLAVRCRNYRGELSLLSTSRGGGGSSGPPGTQNNYIPTDSLSSASHLLDSSKILIRWLTRFPFLGNSEYDVVTVKLTKHCFELAMLSQRDSFADNAIEEVQYLCTKIIEICEELIHSRDSLVIQPAAVDVITLRKRTEQELGLHVESSYFGLHQVSAVKLSSPAQQSGHLEKGDEILQINYQTVVGWPQINVINLLNEDCNEVILTIKRRPRHATANILAHMYLRPSNKLMGSTNRSQRRHGRHSTDKICNHLTVSPGGGLIPAPMSLPSSRRHQKSMPISPVPEDENSSSSTTSSSGNSPVVLLNVNMGEETSVLPPNLSKTTGDLIPGSEAEDSSSTPQLTTGQSLDTIDSDDTGEIGAKSPGLNVGGGLNSGSGSGSDTHSGSTSTKSPNSSSAHSRFWKLYPRPRNLIRRRATVTGASPTSTRPPVTFFDDDNADSSKLRPPLINSKSAPEKIRVGLRKQGHVENHINTTLHRQTMPPSVSVDMDITKADASEAKLSAISSIIASNKPVVEPVIKTTSGMQTVPEIERQQEEVDQSKSADIPRPVPLPKPSLPSSGVTVSSYPTPAPRYKSPTIPNKLTQSEFKTTVDEKACSPVGQPIPLQRRLPSPDKPLSAVPRRLSASVSPDKITEMLPSSSLGITEPTVVLKGILHLRQSPSNLLVKSNSLTSTLNSGTGTGFSPHPRWTRHPATLNSIKILQIGSDPEGSLCINMNQDNISTCEVSLAKEVHSRPFAFKIDIKGKTKVFDGTDADGTVRACGIFYLAAESQSEFEVWMRHLMKQDICDSLFRTPASSSGPKDLMYQKLRSSAPPVYKRSISLGNSPAYSRRNSLITHGTRGNGGGSSSSCSINDSPIYHNRSFVLRKNNLLRSARLVGNSTPNVQASIVATATTPSTASNSVTNISGSKPTPKKSSEIVKSEWFNAPTPTQVSSSPKRFFTQTAPPYRSPYSTPPSTSFSVLRSGSGSGSLFQGFSNGKNISGGSSSNISSITIKSVKKSEGELTSPTTPGAGGSFSRPFSPDNMGRSRTTSGTNKLPSMGVSIMLAKQNNQSPLSSPKKVISSMFAVPATPSDTPAKDISPKKDRLSSSTSTSSSSDVFIKAEAEQSSTHETKRKQRVVNCPSCGGSTSSFSKSDKNAPMRDMSTQTAESEQNHHLTLSDPFTSTIPVSPNLELIRHLINEQEGSRV
ncbi:uncharacterized protein LOC110855562 isoform X1 [Folsomia candida]|uniref:uncharacterized protein LOC110855562 isoform X1 n=1 Tax=Folsomia candida TaxID=158441 RepID=UPI000B8F8105|nr:uncharacterized protein LOC110855562 isoform X1 [Folsomia candida]